MNESNEIKNDNSNETIPRNIQRPRVLAAVLHVCPEHTQTHNMCIKTKPNDPVIITFFLFVLSLMLIPLFIQPAKSIAQQHRRLTNSKNRIVWTYQFRWSLFALFAVAVNPLPDQTCGLPNNFYSHFNT